MLFPTFFLPRLFSCENNAYKLVSFFHAEVTFSVEVSMYTFPHYHLA